MAKNRKLFDMGECQALYRRRRRKMRILMCLILAAGTIGVAVQLVLAWCVGWTLLGGVFPILLTPIRLPGRLVS